VAGDGTAGYSGDEGAAFDSRLNNPFGIAVGNGCKTVRKQLSNYRLFGTVIRIKVHDCAHNCGEINKIFSKNHSLIKILIHFTPY